MSFRTDTVRAGRRGGGWSALLWAACVGCEDPRTSVPAPDPRVFRAAVYPVLLRDCGFAGCHGDPRRPLFTPGPGRVRLDPATDLYDAPTEAELATVTFGEITVDFSSRIVRRGASEVKLTPKEYALLRLLVLHRGKVLTHQQLLREVWGPKFEESTHYLRVHMTHLRQKLEADSHRPRHLKTESGIGYRLVED